MNDIRLEDGSLLEIRLNFLTMKILQKSGVDKLQKKYDKSKDEGIGFDIVSKLIYAVLRSNGRAVDEDEALRLVPMDDEVIMQIINTFSEEMEKLRKKQEAKQNLMS